MAPAFELLVATLIANRTTRGTGLRTGASAVAGALTAKALRDGIGRPRPGERTDGGFPSRHAAAAAAIVTSIGQVHPRAGRAATVAAGAGMLGRVARADHDPADILAGVAVGVATARVLGAVADRIWRSPEDARDDGTASTAG